MLDCNITRDTYFVFYMCHDVAFLATSRNDHDAPRRSQHNSTSRKNYVQIPEKLVLESQERKLGER